MTESRVPREPRRGGVAGDDLRAAIDLISRHRTRDDPGPYSMKVDLDVALETAYEAGQAEAAQPAPPLDGDLYDHLAAMHVIAHGTACPLCNARLGSEAP